MAGAGKTIKQLLSTAETAVNDGNVDTAISIYRQILSKLPKHTKAKKALARLEKRSGGGEKMTQMDAQGLIQLLNTGDFSAVRQSAEQLSKRFPSEPFVYNILGYAAGMVGEEKAALAAFKWAIKLNPNFVEAMSNYGSYLMQIGRPKDAVVQLQKAISKKPDYAEAHHNLGVALVSLDRTEEALQHYNTAIRIVPKYANALNSRGTLKSANGDLREAEADFRSALQISPKDAEILANLGGALSSGGKSDAAIEVLSKALEIDPANSKYLLQMAIIQNEAGHPEQSLATFKSVLLHDPENKQVRRMMLDLVPKAELDAFVTTMQAQIVAPDAETMDKVHLGFALGHHFERQGDFHQSFDYLDLANQSYLGVLPEMPETDAEKFKRITGCFDTDTFAHLKDAASPSDVPIFIVGMMRSGTSLVEQIVASHSQVYGAGELTVATDLAEKLYKKGSKAKAEDLNSFVENYLAKLTQNSDGAVRCIDKMPGNFFQIGILKTAFPNAKFVNLVRDPRDNCFSIYKNFFATHAHQYAYDQAALAQFANSYKNMMNMWDEKFPGEVYHLKYETLVADQEGESRKLLDYLGLPWQDQVLEFHKTKRAVRTASVNQVRQKIYNSSVKSWQNYAPFLGTLYDGLDDDLWADAFVD